MKSVIFLAFLLVLGFAFASECSDHIDNDEDGFCDFISQEAYCSDGASVGDLDCLSINDKETKMCVSEKEVCDGKDNDCNGLVDDNVFEERDCGSNIGECKFGVQKRTCSLGSWTGWGACENEVVPKAEVCDGNDNDCNGGADEYCEKKETSIHLIPLIALIIFVLIFIIYFLKRK